MFVLVSNSRVVKMEMLNSPEAPPLVHSSLATFDHLKDGIVVEPKGMLLRADEPGFVYISNFTKHKVTVSVSKY